MAKFYPFPRFGRRKFCLLYMFCGFLGNLISVAVDPMKPGAEGGSDSFTVTGA